MGNRIYLVYYWKEINDEKCDFECEIEAPTLEKALKIFESRTSCYRIESITEKISNLPKGNLILLEALQKIIEMNYQTAEDQYGDKTKAEGWSCVRVAKEAIKRVLN